MVPRQKGGRISVLVKGVRQKLLDQIGSVEPLHFVVKFSEQKDQFPLERMYLSASADGGWGSAR
ncbi:unnamed protein product [Protopolystoma xenopodis]|uniref:Uncharacterized protein n=1 Tax=Protopolystoma xenopodis TaxID=117903 RepID=A0A448WN70_9PLAT|nr:unnamed protein product [Protopolystoma xenopodis]